MRWYPKSLAGPTSEFLGEAISFDGSYIHVPFCDQICKFCPFHKRLTTQPLVDEYSELLLTEIELSARHLTKAPLRFVYFGGGTPSVLSALQVEKVLDHLRQWVGIDPHAEISMEVHPTHAESGYLRALKDVGVNRVSLGIQSFRPGALQSLGATHSSETASRACRSARETFENFAIDLLYGYHDQSMEEWIGDLNRAIYEFDVPHLSCYAVVPIAKDQRTVSGAREVELAIACMELLQREDRHHYASCASGGFDMCRPGMECRYELDHWKAPQARFLGLGPGAFGFTGTHTTINCLGVEPYRSRLQSGKLPLVSAREVSVTELKHRYFALGVKGLTVPLDPYRKAFGSEPLEDFAEALARLQAMDLVAVDSDRLSLTSMGRLYVDQCSSAFYSDAERMIPHPEEPEIRILQGRS